MDLPVFFCFKGVCVFFPWHVEFVNRSGACPLKHAIDESPLDCRSLVQCVSFVVKIGSVEKSGANDGYNVL